MELNNDVLRAAGSAVIVAVIFFVRAVWMYREKKNSNNQPLTAELVEDNKPQISSDR